MTSRSIDQPNAASIGTDDRSGMKPFGRHALANANAFAIAVVIAMCAFVGMRAGKARVRNEDAGDARAWMSNARDVALGALVIPGTHDSATHYLGRELQRGSETQVPPWVATAVRVAEALRIPADALVRRWAKAQTATTGEQLASGVRFLDIRAGWDGENWRVHHALTGQSVDEVMEEVKTFATSEDGRSEIVLVEISHFLGDPTEDDVERLAVMIEEVFGNLTARYRGGGARALFERTVGDMVDAGDRIVVLFEDADVGKRHGFWPLETITNTYANTDDYHRMETFNREVVSAFNDVNYEPNVALLKLSWTLTTQAQTVIKGLNFLENNPHSLLELAEWKANGHLSAFADEATASQCSIGNIIVVDDLQHSDVVRVALKLNAVGMFPKGECKWVDPSISTVQDPSISTVQEILRGDDDSFVPQA